MPLACVCAGGCAGLRDVPDLAPADVQVSSPSVTNAQGPMRPQAAHSLLLRHWKNSHADTQAMAALEELATSKPLIAGNRVALLYDGPQTIAAMTRAMAQAKDHINLETYIFDDDAVGQPIAALLIAKQRAGVQVHIIYDAVGTVGTPQAFFDGMRAAGIQLIAFNPLNPFHTLGPWEINQRDHRKLLVVDGRIAFAGGVNISSSYANSSLFRSHRHSTDKVGWRDTHLQIEGPAVAALQWEFLDHWVSQHSAPLSDSDFFPTQIEAGRTLVRVLGTEPDGEQEIYRAYLLAIRSAKKSVHITTAYFAPDANILRALLDASQRGVEVTLVLPSVRESSLVFYAGRALYQQLLEGGIQLYLLQTAVLHAKTAVINSVWSTVGSANMDTRSFLHNHELNVMVFDEAFGQAMENAFEEDRRISLPMSLQEWQQRPATERLKEWLASRFDYWL